MMLRMNSNINLTIYGENSSLNSGQNSGEFSDRIRAVFKMCKWLPVHHSQDISSPSVKNSVERVLTGLTRGRKKNRAIVSGGTLGIYTFKFYAFWAWIQDWGDVPP